MKEKTAGGGCGEGEVVAARRIRYISVHARGDDSMADAGILLGETRQRTSLLGMACLPCLV